MAQAVFHEHPLDEYLKESGDKPERIPGSFTDASSDSDDEDESFDVNVVWDDLQQVQISSLQEPLEAVRQWIFSLNSLFPSPVDDFAERFKYDLISSTLLSTSVAPSPVHTNVRAASPPLRPFPGELQIPQQESQKIEHDMRIISGGLVCFGLAALWKEHRATAIFALLLSLVFAKAPSAPNSKFAHIPQTLECLESLKASGNAWDNAVNEAIAIVEKEERSGRYTPSSSLASPSSALRIALQSTLLTTQQQSDNVRPLLSALASPSELSQLSEMYAPSSPIQTSFNLQPNSPSPRRASNRFSTYSTYSENAIASGSGTGLSTSLADKRRTWNGAQAPLRERNTPPPILLRKRDNRRSDMNSLINGGRASPSGLQTPPRSPLLPQVVEDDEEEVKMSGPAEVSLNERDADQDAFGTAALYLRRKRRASGQEVFGLTTSRSVPALHKFQNTSPRSSMSSSRFTSMASSRHPFSLAALHNALHGALSARRYTCAHLLALRFDEDADDEAYWENVRSVTSLLTSSLEDGAHRLNAAISDIERQTQRDSEITPDNSPRNSLDMGSSSAPVPVAAGANKPDFAEESAEKPTLSTRLSQLLESRFTLLPTSNHFAPGPNLIARFSSHVEGMSSSMDDAREHLTDCVKDLQAVMSQDPGNSESEQALLETYDRFRHELGILLRECERGKSVLLDVLEARRRQARGEDEDAEDVPETSPISGHVRTHPTSGSSKDSYDHADLEPLTPTDGSPLITTLPEVQDEDELHVDDASHHLLLSTTAEHLPPAGLEQIYEAEVASAASTFNRERSKLPREERIKLMRSKRESMTGRGLAALLESDEHEQNEKPSRSSWAPTTDVVAELKDVIWKVGERRRRMTADPDAMRSSINALSSTPTLRAESSNLYDTDLCTA